MPIVMFFGSTVAGMTSEGGGAVAFPVMTLLLQIDPSVARDFSLIIQSAGTLWGPSKLLCCLELLLPGMTCAMCVVLIMEIQIEKRAILFGTLGSIPGFIVGSVFMLFVSIWSSFAVALYILNSQHKRRTYDVIPEFNLWKTGILVVTGFVGGVFTAFAGSGVDICTFSIITLLFRVSEKTATPTSVVLMGKILLKPQEHTL
ncbi:unnamed protein product [Cylicostephanus goldi]|uniref:Membrane transporter protein n=1 Tax=Cylicostephanus goldi TaxID=71465 RepID=A0A3P7QRP3_CYLGO|nr:unnamed protein product [Cylicostephanus goldi]